MGISPVCLSVHCMYTVAMEAKGDIRSLGTGVAKGCEPPHGCWDSDPAPLEEQPVFSTVELPLQPPHHMLNKITVAAVLATDCSKVTVKKLQQVCLGVVKGQSDKKGQQVPFTLGGR